MGIDGFTPAQYDQLVLDVRTGVPPPQPSLIVTLPAPRSVYPCKRKTTHGDLETDDDDNGSEMVLSTPPGCD